MPVNEFEKQLQQKMDELKLRPSGQVWEEVEKRIRKEKKRRSIVLWFLLFALLLGGGTTWYFIQDDKTDTTIVEKQVAPRKQTIDTKDNAVPVINEAKQQPSTSTINNNNKPATSAGNSSASGGLPVSIGKKTITPQKIKETGSETRELFTTINSNKKQEKEIRKTSLIKDEIVSMDITAGQKKKSNNDNKPVQVNRAPVIIGKTNDTVAKAIEPTLIETDKPEEIKETASTDSVIATTIEIVKPAIDSIDKKEESKANLSLKKKNKWHWGVSVLPGISHTVQGKLFSGLFGEQKNADAPFSTPSAVTGGLLVPFAPPVLIESPTPGFSFDIGLIAQRPVSKRLDFGAGIHYSYISTRVKVGNKVQTNRQINNNYSSSVTVNSYYRANAAYPNNGGQVYTNQYNLVGLSASLSWKLIQKKNFSLSWDNSFMGSRIVSTNALLYDGSLRGYYKDLNAFRKTQLFMATGFTIPVIEKNKFTLSLYPSISYGLTPVLKHSSSMNSHFVNYGIGLKLLIK
ncbi:MAG TPA: hypothetical protein VF487_05225 [Chitinophagaceae bacterium]